MVKTTVYLPDELKQRLGSTARRTGRSEAELIRTAVERLVREENRPTAGWGQFESDDPTLAERTDELLAAGFGER